jgi:hypothetical protein
MFSRSLDGKKNYILEDGTEAVDLSESIFDPNKAMTQVCSIYKVRKEYEMRPDLVSMTLYGSTDYAEMILKYSLINNPFALEKDDLIYAAALSSIYNPLKDTDLDNNGVFDAVKNYHKYIDKSKVPEKAGSDKVTVEIPGAISTKNGNGNKNRTDSEANISKTGDTGITVKDGKIYFGDIDSQITKVDSSIVNCAENGTSIGEFLNAALRNA